MISEKIDLYEYFALPKKGATGGFLTVIASDVFLETGNAQRYPAMLVIAGGGYGMVSRREADPVAFRFSADGFQTFILDYTVNTPFPVPLVEAAMAMAYIRENAEKYLVNPQKVCAVGFSAGGHLTGMLATLFAEEAVKEALGAHAKNVRPDAVILSYPVVTCLKKTHGGTAEVISGGNEALKNALSIEKRVTENSSPAFIWHTFEDEIVPTENSLQLASAYKKAGVPFELHIFEAGRHGLSVMNGFTEHDLANTKLCAREWMALAVNWLQSRGFTVTK